MNRALTAAACVVLASCSGSDAGSLSGVPDPNGGSGWQPSLFMPSASFSGQCAAPRSGTDPTTGAPYADVQGTALAENNWLRSWSNELYLWYDEIVDRDPAGYDPQQYFGLLKTFATTPSGTPKDKFHFTFPTAEWLALSQSGASAGYGAVWAVISPTPPREVVVAYIEPDAPAKTVLASIARGAKVLRVDGVDVVNANDSASAAALTAGLFPSEPGETHEFVILDPGASTSRTITLESTIVTSTPVQYVKTIATGAGPVGYMLFNDHIATAEQLLIDAVDYFKGENIADLVLDVRYNGGGYLVLASELAYMIAGNASTDGRTFEALRFNDKHPSTDPVTGQPLAPLPFVKSAYGLSATPGQPLPALNLGRVFVITGPTTCSASESIINSLRGVDVEVIQIGSTTCGKPYGFYPADNCGTTYFSIQFKGVNAKDFGDYTDGFSPQNTLGVKGTAVPGCSVADDFSHELGDPEEGRLKAALAYRLTQTCPPPSGTASPGFSKPSPLLTLSESDGKVPKSAWLENRILANP